MDDRSLRPIVIKRKKVMGSDGHHGGAWKVAYADFVTAMMAFFMLMWLLNATTETQRKGLADYFSPTIAVARVSGGGDGAFSGDSLFEQTHLPKAGNAAVPAVQVASGRIDAGVDFDKQNAAFDKVATGILGKGGDSLIREMALDHIVTQVTDEGLVVEIFDLEGSPLFDVGTDNPTRILREISKVLVDVFVAVGNKIAVSAHSRSYPSVLKENPAWRLTMERAHAMRVLMERDGAQADRFERVTGFGQSKPIGPDPMHHRNNRLEVVLLR